MITTFVRFFDEMSSKVKIWLGKPWFTDAYLALLSALSFFCWHTGIGLPGLVVFPALLWFWAYTRQTALILPLPLFFVPVFRYTLGHVGEVKDPLTVINLEVIFSIVAGVSALLFALVREWRRTAKSPLLAPLLLVAISMSLSIIASPVPFASALGVFTLLVLAMAWSVLLNGQAAGIDLTMLYSRTIGWFCGLTATMTLVTVIQSVSVSQAIMDKDINIGWSISNNISTYLVYGLPFIFYLSLKGSSKYVHYVLMLVCVTAVFVTGSRAGALGLAIGGGISLIYLAFNYSLRKNLSHVLIALALAMPLFIAILYFDMAESVYHRLFVSKFFFYFDDRRKLLELAIQVFKDHPLLGAGAYSAGYFIQANGGKTISYHNVLFEVAASFGIVGIIAFSYFMWAKFKLLLRQVGPFKIMGIIALLGSYVFALVDTSYMNPIYLYLVFGLLAVAEDH